MMMIMIVVIAIFIIINIIFLLLATTVSVPVIVPCLSYWLIILSLTQPQLVTLHSSCFFASTLPTWFDVGLLQGYVFFWGARWFLLTVGKGRKIISVAILPCDESNGRFWRATGIRTVDPRDQNSCSLTSPQLVVHPYIAVSLQDVPVRNPQSL